MTIEVAQLSGDTVELLFNPDEEELYVGANLSVVDRHNRGLIIQIIELKIIPPPRDVPPQVGRRPLSQGSPGATATIAAAPKRKTFPSPKPFPPRRHMAVAKIRKMIDVDWRSWDGWIPQKNVAVSKVTDYEILHHCVPNTASPLRLGTTQAGADFSIDGTLIGGINLLVGTQEAAISLLVRYIADELAVAGVPCVIFDTRGTYTQLDAERQSLPERSTRTSRLIHLVPGENLKLGVQQLRSAGIVSLLTRFGLPTTAALYFESHLTRRMAWEKPAQAVMEPHRFLGMDELVQIARDLESTGETVTGGAILSCLEAIRQTRLMANVLAETTTWMDSYAQIRNGGTLVIDLSRFDSRLRRGLVQSIVDMIWVLSTSEAEGTPPADQVPCVFFDEAQALVTRHLIDNMTRPTRRRHMTGFLVTERVSSLDATLLQQVDHLFLRRLASDRDALHLAQGGIIDAETLQTLARRLPQHHSLLVGEATGGYPIIFALDPASSDQVIGARLASSDASAKAAEPATSSRRHMPPVHPHIQASPAGEHSLPLFPEHTPSFTTDPTSPHPESQHKDLQPPLPTLAQVNATWDHIVKRVARRRRILETILSTARPLRLAGKQVVLGFPPQQRFQQELIQSDDYRHLIEEELRKAFGGELEVTTELYPV